MIGVHLIFAVLVMISVGWSSLQRVNYDPQPYTHVLLLSDDENI